jgi:hypothetical protein
MSQQSSALPPEERNLIEECAPLGPRRMIIRECLLSDIQFPLPPSANNLYATSGQRRILSVEAEGYKATCISRIHERYGFEFTVPLQTPLGIKERSICRPGRSTLPTWTTG